MHASRVRRPFSSPPLPRSGIRACFATLGGDMTPYVPLHEHDVSQRPLCFGAGPRPARCLPCIATTRQTAYLLVASHSRRHLSVSHDICQRTIVTGITSSRCRPSVYSNV